jgi:hypothetical protein
MNNLCANTNAEYLQFFNAMRFSMALLFWWHFLLRIGNFRSKWIWHKKSFILRLSIMLATGAPPFA